MRPARYVEIDCDLYSSTVQALTWLFEEGLIVEGTVLGYDDFYAGGADGEKKAHHELMRKYRVKLEVLRPDCCFVVKSWQRPLP